MRRHDWKEIRWTIGIILWIMLILLAVDWLGRKVTSDLRVEVPIGIPYKVPSETWSEDEINCLARTIYGEARNQPYEGQLAVGAVIVTRSLSPNWPHNLCDVVQQRGQFAGYHHRLFLTNILEKRAYQHSREIALRVTYGYAELPSKFKKMQFFDATYSNSDYHRGLQHIALIGDHNFWRGKRL